MSAAFAEAAIMVFVRRLAGALNFTIQPFYYMLTNNVLNSIWGFAAPSQKITQYGTELYFWALGMASLKFLEQSSFVKSM